MISLTEESGFVKGFLKKRSIFLERSTIVFPFRDKQRDWPRDFCCLCGQEQYAQDPPLAAGLCWQCREGERKREEDGMTLEEMAVEYRSQAARVRERIRALEQAGRGAGSEEERVRLRIRSESLEPIWREARDLAVLLEHYYERGYRRNDRYTI